MEAANKQHMSFLRMDPFTSYNSAGAIRPTPITPNLLLEANIEREKSPNARTVK